jgi:hypothetical protein
MKDDLKIRELYEEMMLERAAANGHVILEYVKIPSSNSTPEVVRLGDVTLQYGDPSARPFSFIGGDNLIGYVNDSEGTHPTIFNAFNILAAALGLTEFPSTAQVAKSKWEGSTKAQSGKILKSYDVSYFGNIDESNLSKFANSEWEGTMSNTRVNTSSGRLWRGVKSNKIGKPVDIIAFWCDTKDVTPNKLNNLIKSFKLGDVFWCAMDSNNFNHVGGESEEGNTKKLKSKIYPDATHDQIVDILMRAHSNLNLSPWEKKIVWEFRGLDNSEIRSITGGYPTRAEYVNRSKFSESKENDRRKNSNSQ